MIVVNGLLKYRFVGKLSSLHRISEAHPRLLLCNTMIIHCPKMQKCICAWSRQMVKPGGISLRTTSIAQIGYKPLSTSAKSFSKSKEEEKLISKTMSINTTPLPHFKTASKKEVDDKANLSLNEVTLHPDIEEGRSMDDGGYRLPHPIWSKEELESVKITHCPPVGNQLKAIAIIMQKVETLAYFAVQLLRRGFDLLSGYTLGCYTGRLDEKQWLKRIIFLETVAGVPGMVGAMVRHLISLRRLERDHGWIHTLLEEAENERMHLMTAMKVANPGILMRLFIAVAQGVFVTNFSVAYLLSPRFCHRFVGYLEEEAVKTYTHCLHAIDTGELKMWSRMMAPELAIEYWKLPPDAMMRDVILAIRADEAHHRVVNHTLSSIKTQDKNPYPPGQ